MFHDWHTLKRIWTWSLGLAFLFIALPLWIAIWYSRSVWLGHAQLALCAYVLWEKLIVPAWEAWSATVQEETP